MLEQMTKKLNNDQLNYNSHSEKCKLRITLQKITYENIFRLTS